jgi:hypothetical protein
VVLVAFGLRAWHLTTQSFWWDEAYSTMVATSSLSGIVAEIVKEDFHPPFHYFLLHYWIRIAGMSELAIRFVSVWAGVLTVALAWATGRRLFGVTGGLFAAVAFAISPFLWYYNQEARMFAFVPLFGLLALYACDRATTSTSRLPWVVYTVAVALGIYDFYYSVFFPFVCGGWILLARPTRRNVVGWLVATIAAFVLYLPWVPIFLFRTSVWASAFTPDNGPVKIVTWSWPEFILGLPSLALYQERLPLALLFAAALFLVVAVALAVRARRKVPGLLLAALAFVGPLAAMAAISAIKPVFHPRYAIPAEPGLLLLWAGVVATLLAGTGGRGAARKVVAGLLAGFVVLTSVYGLMRLSTDPAFARDDYRDAIAYVDQRQQTGDTIIHNAIPPFWYYHHGPAPAAYFPSRPYTEANVVDELNAVVAGHDRLWYVSHAAIPNDPAGFVDSQLKLHATRLDERWFGALRVQLWKIGGGQPFSAAAFQPANVNFANEFTITGYSLAGEPVGGSVLNAEVQMSTQRAPKSDDGFWVALVDGGGKTWGRADVRPRNAGYALSSAWSAGESVVARFDLPVDVGTPPGTYQIQVGAYRLSDLGGLDVFDAGQHPIGQQATIGSLGVAKVTLNQRDTSLKNQQSVEAAPGLTLIGDEFKASVVAPGDVVPVTLLWQSKAALGHVAASVAIQPASGPALTSADAPIGGDFPTEKWPVGATVREQRAVAVPATTPAGKAALVLKLPNGASATLGSIDVKAVQRDFSAPTLAHPVSASFGDSLALTGYQLSPDPPRRGSALGVTLSWHALRTPTVSYHVFVHLLDAKEHIWAQWDGEPKNWTYPVTAWVPGEYVSDSYSLDLPGSLPAGTYAIEVGLYDPATGQRLSVAGSAGPPAADHLVLQQVVVAP